MDKIRVVIVDDHQVVIDGLANMFSSQPEIEVILATTNQQ